jgi:hypothetical protein
MFSFTLAKDLVYGALALSLVCALATMAAVIWGIGRIRRRRWPWAWAAQIVVSAAAAWFWLYPSLVIGAIAGGELGAQVGHGLSPTGDATLMALGIGLGTYVVFTAPMAVLALLVGLAVTAPPGSSETDPEKDAVRTARIGQPAMLALGRLVHSVRAAAPAHLGRRL